MTIAKKARRMDPRRVCQRKSAADMLVAARTQIAQMPVTAERDAEKRTASIGQIRRLVICDEQLSRQHADTGRGPTAGFGVSGKRGEVPSSILVSIAHRTTYIAHW